MTKRIKHPREIYLEKAEWIYFIICLALLIGFFVLGMAYTSCLDKISFVQGNETAIITMSKCNLNTTNMTEIRVEISGTTENFSRNFQNKLLPYFEDKCENISLNVFYQNKD